MNEYELGKRIARAIYGQSRVAAKSLGVDLALSPEETEAIAIGAGLPPIADGVQWKSGLNLAEGTIVVFEGANYQVIQGHISQSGWTPTATPALFKKLTADYADWKQPQGAHDAYMKGDKVSHIGKRWTSTVDGNVWEPSVHGWTEVA